MIPYKLVVFAHIASAVMLLGGSLLATPVVRSAVRRARTPQELSASLAVARPLSMVSPIAALLLLATGVYLTSVGHWWELGWIQVAVALWVVNSVTARFVVEPATHRLAVEAAAVAGGTLNERLDALRWSRGWSLGIDLLLANDAAVLLLMTVKPGLTGSILAVAAVNALVFMAGLAVRRTRVPGVTPSDAPPLVPASGG